MSMQHEVLGSCEFIVDSPPEQPEGIKCGGPACYRIWCKDDKSDAKCLCFDHYMEVRADNKDNAEAKRACLEGMAREAEEAYDKVQFESDRERR